MYTEVTNVWASKAKIPDEAASLQLRAQVMLAIRQLIHENGWSQMQAARQFGITQPRVSYIINGQVSKFTLDKLLGLLTNIGYTFDFSLQGGIPHFETRQVA